MVFCSGFGANHLLTRQIMNNTLITFRHTNHINPSITNENVENMIWNYVCKYVSESTAVWANIRPKHDIHIGEFGFPFSFPRYDTFVISVTIERELYQTISMRS